MNDLTQKETKFYANCYIWYIFIQRFNSFQAFFYLVVESASQNFDNHILELQYCMRKFGEILAWSGSTTWLCFRTNYVSVLCMRSTANTQSHAQYTYMISWEHNYVVLPDHVRISRKFVQKVNYTRTSRDQWGNQWRMFW